MLRLMALRVCCVLMALVVACASPTPPSVTPGVSPSPTPTSGQAPDQPTTSARADQATAAPADRDGAQRADLAQARLLLVEGDYTAATERLRKLVADASAADQARAYLALSLTYAGQPSDALRVVDAVPSTDAGFARGLALDATNQHAEAMHAMAEFAATHPDLSPAVWLEIAERELDARRYQDSSGATARGLDSAQTRPLKQRLLEVRAQALTALGDTEAAFDAHRQILALATDRATLGEQLFNLARASRDLGKRDAAVQALKTALDEFPSASTTPDALRLLDDLGATASSEIDPFVLGRARYFAVDYRNAVNAFDQYLKADPNGPDAPAARLYRALASLTPGNESNALRELDVLADDPDQDTEIAAQALAEAGQALEGLSQPDQAEARYTRLLSKFPRLDAAAGAAFRLGLLRFARGADAAAIAAWDELLARRDNLPPDDTSRALYWRAKALSRLGRDADARLSLEQAAATRPVGYYAVRALLQLNSGHVSTSSWSITPDDEQQLGQWMAAHNLSLSSAADIVGPDPVVVRATSESRLGLFRQGNWEADELLQRYRDRADRLYVLSRRFGELGLFGGSTRLGQAAYAAAAIQSPRDAPAALLKLAFPRPLANLTDTTAARYGVDPLWLEAMLRDASQFDPWAENAATGARGLAQMSPVHLDEAAHALRVDPDFDVLRPKSAVELQTWMLADRLRRFDGRPEAALGAMSTTDRLVDGWLVRPGAEDPDVFVESIDYEGVRASLRSVLGTLLTYALAYGSAADPLSRSQTAREPTATWIKIARVGTDVPADTPLSPPPSIGADAERQRAFARGATFQRDGDYDAAVEIFRGLASGPEGGTTGATEARLRLGQALLGTGRAVDALEALRAADAAQPGSAATFLLGRAEAEVGRCEAALGYLERFEATNPGALAAQAQATRASCLLDLGRGSEAVSLLAQAAATPDLPRLQMIDFREKLALARVRAGDIDGARAEYEALLALARSSSYRAELNYYLGELTADASAAAARFRSAVELDPRGRASQAALDELVALRDPFAMSYEAAETLFEQNRYREAMAAYATFLQDNPSDGRAAQAAYGWGVSLVRLGQDRAGVAMLEQTQSRWPSTRAAADAMFRAARVRESLAELEAAAEAYRQVMANPRAGSKASEAQFRLAFVRFRQAHTPSQSSTAPNEAQATEGWRSLAAGVTAPDDRAQALFWLGKALDAAGDVAGARAAWTSARDADPYGFYGLRASELLRGEAEPTAQVNLTLPLVSARADEETTSWSEALPPSLAADPGLQRADALLAMGLRQQAIWELGVVESQLGNNTSTLAALGIWEQRRGLYNTALLLGGDLAARLNVSQTTAPAAVRRLLYPLPHPSVLAQAAQRLRVDPLLLCALMRQESMMDPSVESAAQARGLTQLLASTGYESARALGLYGFRGTDLFRPKTSIMLGAFTLGQRLRRYDQRIFPSLAAYNAAQFAVDGWLLATTPTDVDTFAEAIPFTETYPYVQRIYENYQQYLELYGSQ